MPDLHVYYDYIKLQSGHQYFVHEYGDEDYEEVSRILKNDDGIFSVTDSDGTHMFSVHESKVSSAAKTNFDVTCELCKKTIKAEDADASKNYFFNPLFGSGTMHKECKERCVRLEKEQIEMWKRIREGAERE